MEISGVLKAEKETSLPVGVIFFLKSNSSIFLED